MMDSERKQLRRRKTKKILIWITGIIAVVAIVATIVILSSMGDSGYITS